MLGFGGGPNRPTAPVAGLKIVPPTGLFVARRQIADTALKLIGIVEPGRAWMLLSLVGSVKLMITNAFELPVTCHSPAAATVGSTDVGTPLMTVPKFKSLKVAIVMPAVTTTAAADTDAPDCATARPGTPRHTASTRMFLTAPRSELNREPPAP